MLSHIYLPALEFTRLVSLVLSIEFLGMENKSISVPFLYVMHYAEGHYTKCHDGECQFAECHGTSSDEY